MPSPFDALKPLAGRALEAALNRALTLDPDAQAGLAALDGRRVSLALEAPALALEIRVSRGYLQVGPALEPAADLAVKGTIGGLLGQLPFVAAARARSNGAPTGRLNISGDADLARRLQQLASRFDPDWQQPFVEVFGEVLGVQIARAVATGLRQARETAGALARNAAEFVTEESRDVVPRGELAAFHDDVDAIRDDVERMAARVARLSARGAGA